MISSQSASSKKSCDATNATGNVIVGGDVANVLLQTDRMSDGAMLAWRTLVLRSSTGEPHCQLLNGGWPRHGVDRRRVCLHHGPPAPGMVPRADLGDDSSPALA